MKHEFVVAAAGERLDRLIALQVPELSRARAQQLISEGFVSVGGRPCAKASERPAAGARVRVEVPPPRAVALVPEDLRLPVLYEDGELLVIDKPAGIAVHPGAGASRATVVHGLLYQVSNLAGVGGELRPGIVHRLDKDTSGCLVVAKTERALRGLQAQFKSRQVEKRYRALVHGAPPERGNRRAAVAPSGGPQAVLLACGRGRQALTRFAVISRTREAAWLEVELLTGRTHQIRAHFADQGWPLFCDKLYGGTRREGPKAPPAVRRAAEALGRQGLHAFRLGFSHPLTGARVECEAPLPADLRAALGELGLEFPR